MKQTDLQPGSHKRTKPLLQSTVSKPKSRKHVNSVVSKKNVKKKSHATRRSVRIRNTAISSESQRSEPYIEEITSSVSEDERKEEEPPVKVDKNIAKPTAKGLEKKIDNHVRLIEAKTSETLNSEANKIPSRTKNPFSLDVTYKSMYVDSQKKIEELKEIIRQLTQKLENALCKVEVYEKCNRDSSEILEKLKDLDSILRLAKFPETAIDAQYEALHVATPPPPEPEICGSERKKQTKRRKRR